MSGFERLRLRLEGKAVDPTARPVIYVAFGDSVTQGCMEYATIEHQAVFHTVLKRAIETRFPTTIFSVINAGVSGDTADQSRHRWQRDILGFNPDLVTIGFGVNDAHQGREGLHLYEAALRDLIQVIRSDSDAEIILITPNMMVRHDNVYVHDDDRKHLPLFLKTAEERYLELYTSVMKQIAVEEQVPIIDQYAMWCKLEADGIDIHSRLANGINHPDRDFHAQLAVELERLLFNDHSQ